jgi:hypothetical protein
VSAVVVSAGGGPNNPSGKENHRDNQYDTGHNADLT